MEIHSENFIDDFQHLYSIAEDGKEGYHQAAAQTASADLKAKFELFSSQREELARQLTVKIYESGGTPDRNHGGTLSALHRSWLHVKTVFAKNNDQVILETCKNGDLAALAAYDDILQGEILNTSLKEFLSEQRLVIHLALNEIDQLYFSTFTN